MEPLSDIKEKGKLQSKTDESESGMKFMASKQKGAKPVKKIKIFLVDDDLVFLSALKNVIAGIDEKIAVTTFATGEECIENLSAKPSIVILDYYLDSQLYNAMNGISVLKKIKQLNPDTHVIMLSAQSNIDVALDTVKYKAYDYVLKSDEAFIRIKNIVQHILLDIKTTEDIDNEISTYRIVNILIIVVLIVLFLLSRFL